MYSCGDMSVSASLKTKTKIRLAMTNEPKESLCNCFVLSITPPKC